MMVDIVGKVTRSKMMSNIRGRDTIPELVIRKGMHKLGTRFRLYDKRLPGKPDLYFPKYNAVIFVNGCFWHRHYCHYFKWPSTRPKFWKEKLEGNVKRDISKWSSLEKSGIRVLVIWECAIRGKDAKSIEQVLQRAENWLKSGNASEQIPAEPQTIDERKMVY